MDKAQKLLEAFKQNMQQPATPTIVPGIAKNVGENSCDVQVTSNDILFTDVLFNATDISEGGFVLVPKENTNVLVGSIGGDENSLYLVTMDEISAFKLKIDNELVTFDVDGFRAELTSGKLTMKNASADLKDILKSIVTMVKNVTVSTANGPSGTPLAPTIASAGQIETKITNLFD